MDDIGNASVIAFAAGMRMGEQMQVDQAIQSWETYAASLQEQLEMARSTIAQQDISITSLNNQIGIYKSAYEKLQVTAKEICVDLDESNRKIGEMGAEETAYKKLMENKISSVWRACQSMSANAAAYEELYKLLVKEIQTKHNPEDFDSLDWDKRRAVIKGVWDSFAKTGKFTHHPDFTFGYQRKPEL